MLKNTWREIVDLQKNYLRLLNENPEFLSIWDDGEIQVRASLFDEMKPKDVEVTSRKASYGEKLSFQTEDGILVTCFKPTKKGKKK